METKNLNAILWQIFQKTSTLMAKVRARELHQFGITLRSSAVLNTIIEFGEAITISDIAKQLGLEAHSMSAQLKRMEKERLIEKFKKRGKKNLINIRITDKGYEILDKDKASGKKTINSIMSVLTDEEKHRLWVIINKIREQAIIELSMMNYDIYPRVNPNDLATQFE